jgi:hypothetical protein
MRTNAAARRTQESETPASGVSRPASGRRMKAATPHKADAPEGQLALALTDALEHILAYEERSA